ncbi:MAG: GIY-YIG nuclease family protein [bacterium]|nr:GIY-YIG nuclease family protein [bacterium]
MYHVYILRCADGSLYTGITTELERRVKEHNANDSHLGSKYVYARRPAVLVWSRTFADRSFASVEEARIKRLDRKGKLAIIETGSVVM